MTPPWGERADAYIAAAGLGLLLGNVVWFTVFFVGDQEPPDAPTGSGRVDGQLGSPRIVDDLGEPCALIDEKLLQRLYGDGTARAAQFGNSDTSSECEWTAAPTSVTVAADLEDYPEGVRAVNRADAEYESDRTDAEEGDPVRGLPEQLTDLGDEAYVVYAPKTGERRSAEEETRLKVRRGNVLVTVTIVRTPESSVVGHDRMVEGARQIAAAAVAALR